MTYRHFDLDLAELKRSLAGMGSLVEQLLTLAVEAIVHPNVEARERARDVEERLDQLDAQIEERCHQLIALQSPVARDLRLLLAATRITADLEQVGDLSESITKRARAIARTDPIPGPPELERLGRLALAMLRACLDAFVSGDVTKAQTVMRDEEEADQLTAACYRHLEEALSHDHQHVRGYAHLLRAVGKLEQVADLTVSIAEEAVYLHRGVLDRHHHDAH